MSTRVTSNLVETEPAFTCPCSARHCAETMIRYEAARGKEGKGKGKGKGKE